MASWHNAADGRCYGKKLPLFAIVASSIITCSVQSAGSSVAPLAKLALNLRIENVLITYVTYIHKMFWSLDLVAHYPFSLEALSAAKPGASALFMLGVTAATLRYAQRLPYLAIAYYRTAVLANITSKDVAAIADAHDNLGYALFSQGDMQAAKKHYASALSLIPDHEEAQQNMRELDEALRQPSGTTRDRAL
ncbi:MAG: hypothetical protein R8K46_07150 [Mariprofundaceae bacterium]